MTLAVRSLMFVPGGRVADLLPKLARCRPDVAVVDLEDAVAPGDKDAARDAAVAALAVERPAAGAVLVRINGPGTPWHDADLAAVAAASVDGVVLPKYEHAEQLGPSAPRCPQAQLVVVGLESALGIADARPLLAEGPDAAYVGTEDLIADLGGRRTAAGTEVLYARSYVVLAARLASVPAIDQVVAAVRDTEAFRFDAEQARDLGYDGKICLHPLQVPIAHAAFTPSEEELAHARAVLAAAAGGVGLVDGQMVDAAHIAHGTWRSGARRGSRREDRPDDPAAHAAAPRAAAGPARRRAGLRRRRLRRARLLPRADDQRARRARRDRGRHESGAAAQRGDRAAGLPRRARGEDGRHPRRRSAAAASSWGSVSAASSPPSWRRAASTRPSAARAPTRRWRS